MLLEVIVYRRVGGWTVMLRPVELDAAGDPWTGKAYQGRLDHVVIIYEVIIIGFV